MTFIEWCKTIDWQKINDVSESLDDLNDSQFRFIKGRFIELLVEDCSKGVLTFVGEKHKDFDCKKYNCTIELKSEVSQNLYKKVPKQKGKFELKPNFGIRFNNSMGTNSNTVDPNHVTDYLIIIKSDGVVLVDKQNVLQNIKIHGDGCTLSLQPHKVTELTGRIVQKDKYKLDIKWRIDNLLKVTIQHLDTMKV